MVEGVNRNCKRVTVNDLPYPATGKPRRGFPDPCYFSYDEVICPYGDC